MDAKELEAVETTKSVTREQLWNLSQQLTRKVDTGKDPDFEKNYPDRFWGKLGQVKWDVQFSKEGPENNGQKIKIDINGKPAEIKSLARVWMTQTGDQEGKGNAVCYLLGENGQWYKETANSFRYVAETNTSFWNLEHTEKVNADEQQVMLQGLLGEVRGKDNPDIKDTRNQTKKITLAI